MFDNNIRNVLIPPIRFRRGVVERDAAHLHPIQEVLPRIIWTNESAIKKYKKQRTDKETASVITGHPIVLYYCNTVNMTGEYLIVVATIKR